MSSIIENRASCTVTGRSIHFNDRSWKKCGNWKIYRGYCRGDLGEMVKLCLKVPVNDYWSEDECNQMIEKHEKIEKLAETFNQRVSPSSKIKVIVPRKAYIDRTAGVHMLKGRRRSLSLDELILVFEKIGNKLETFVTRDGFSKDDVIQAFLHFTYHASEGKFVVRKLRGVRKGSTFVLSCPSIHDKDNDITRVMSNHKCNTICSGFLMPKDVRHSTQGSSPVDIPQAVPSAPPQEDSESDDDVFGSPIPKYEEADFWWNSRNDCHTTSAQYGQGGMGFGQDIPTPPPYSSQCPVGHRVAYRFEPCDVNGNHPTWNTNQHLLVFWDTAPVQQTSMNSYGLS